jgi:predicted nucleic acid-binding protein
MYLFDTDTLSNIVKRRPSEQLLRRLRGLPMGLQHTTSINIGEIYYGACRTQRRDQIIKAFEVHVFPNITILPFDKKSGVAFGRLKATLEKQGIGCSEPDLRIAAIAMQHGLIVITGNVKHFADIPGLSVENWIEYPSSL